MPPLISHPSGDSFPPGGSVRGLLLSMRTPSALFENGCNIAPFPLRGRCQPFGLTDEVARVNFLLSHPSPNTNPKEVYPI